MKKNDFDNKLKSFNRWISSNKTKNLKAQNNLTSLITNDYKFFLSDDGSLKTFVYQPTLDSLELKRDKGTDYVLIWETKRSI